MKIDKIDTYVHTYTKYTHSCIYMHLAQALCWVAATLFDFKGCLEPHLDALQFFSGDTAVCLHTSISYVCMYVTIF